MSKLIKRKQLSLKLKNPADGLFGTSNIPGVLQGDELEDSLDKIISVLDRLAPALPPALNNLTLGVSIAGTTPTSLVTGNTLTGTTVTDIAKFTDSAVITWTTSGSPAPSADSRDGHFRDGASTTAALRVTHSFNATTKTAVISNFDQIPIGGTVTATDSVDGYDVNLNILEKEDYWSADADAISKSGFYESLRASMDIEMLSGVNAADTLPRTIELEYSQAGDFTDSLILTGTYRLESATAPASTTPTFTGLPTMAGTVSGVPSLESGDSITITSTITNGIKKYYPSTIGSSTVTGTSNTSTTLSGTQTEDSSFAYAENHTFLGSRYSETIAGSVTPFDVFGAGSVANATTLTSLRIDTISLAKAVADGSSRLLSPTTSEFENIAGTNYTITEHSNTLDVSTGVYSRALQLLNGVYQYPENKDYASVSGPDYTHNVGNFPSNQYRYADFELTSVNNATSVILNINGGDGLTGSSNLDQINSAGLKLYLRVDGASPTGGDGWIDCNSAYPGVGTPTGVGGSRAAVDVGFSGGDARTRRITFSVVRTGTVSVRIGIQQGSPISFSNITIS